VKKCRDANLKVLKSWNHQNYLISTPKNVVKRRVLPKISSQNALKLAKITEKNVLQALCRVLGRFADLHRDWKFWSECGILQDNMRNKILFPHVKEK